MDSTASTLSMDNDIDLVVFNMNQPGNIKRVVFGEKSYADQGSLESD